MLTILITFLVLFGLIKIFERKREDLDGFQAAVVAIIPVVSAMLVQFALAIVYPEPLALILAPALVLVGLTFYLLYKNLDLPLGRSIAYTVVVIVVNQAVALLFAAG